MNYFEHTIKYRLKFTLNFSPLALVLLATPELIKTKGSIINISSAAANANTSAIMYYIASKVCFKKLPSFLLKNHTELVL